MDCPSCGKTVPDDSRLCPYCGVSFTADSPAAPKKRRKKRLVIVLACVAVVCCAAVLAGMWLLPKLFRPPLQGVYNLAKGMYYVQSMHMELTYTADGKTIFRAGAHGDGKFDRDHRSVTADFGWGTSWSDTGESRLAVYQNNLLLLRDGSASKQDCADALQTWFALDDVYVNALSTGTVDIRALLKALGDPAADTVDADAWQAGMKALMPKLADSGWLTAYLGFTAAKDGDTAVYTFAPDWPALHQQLRTDFLGVYDDTFAKLPESLSDITSLVLRVQDDRLTGFEVTATADDGTANTLTGKLSSFNDVSLSEASLKALLRQAEQ